MPPWYFDSEDTSVIGEAERVTRQFVPTNTEAQSAFGDVATSTRRTLLLCTYIDESIGTGIGDGFSYINSTDYSNWNDDFSDWFSNFTVYPVNVDSQNTTGMFQNAMNIACGHLLQITHTPTSGGLLTAAMVAQGPTEIPFQRSLGIRFAGVGDVVGWYPSNREPNRDDISSLLVQASAIQGIRAPDFVITTVDESGSMNEDEVQPGLNDGLDFYAAMDGNVNSYIVTPLTLEINERYVGWLHAMFSTWKDT